jgi:hypothetical protein
MREQTTFPKKTGLLKPVRIIDHFLVGGNPLMKEFRGILTRLSP